MITIPQKTLQELMEHIDKAVKKIEDLERRVNEVGQEKLALGVAHAQLQNELRVVMVSLERKEQELKELKSSLGQGACLEQVNGSSAQIYAATLSEKDRTITSLEAEVARLTRLVQEHNRVRTSIELNKLTPMGRVCQAAREGVAQSVLITAFEAMDYFEKTGSDVLGPVGAAIGLALGAGVGTVAGGFMGTMMKVAGICNWS